MSPDAVPAFPCPATWASLRREGCQLHPSHIENASFDKVLELSGARATRFKGGTPASPRSGRHILLGLPSGRYASITNYDDFPASLEISLQTRQADPDAELVVHMSDLMSILSPLGFPEPDKSKDGGLTWLG